MHFDFNERSGFDHRLDVQPILPACGFCARQPLQGIVGKALGLISHIIESGQDVACIIVAVI